MKKTKPTPRRRARAQVKPKPTPKRPQGRPTVRTPAIENAVVDWIADGNTLADFARQPGMPHRTTVNKWRAEDPAFDRRFARARENGFDEIAERLLRMISRFDGHDSPVLVARHRLIVDATLKLLAKWDPKRYGDMMKLEHSGKLDLADAIRRARERAAAGPGPDESGE